MRMTFDMRAPEIRERIKEHAQGQGIPITLVYLRQFKDTRFLYGAMRSVAKGRTDHPITRQWLKEHPPEEVGEEVEQMCLTI